MQECTSVIVLDENSASREVIKSYLDEYGAFNSIKLFGNYQEGFEEIKNLDGNCIVIMDITNIKYGTIEIAEKIKLYTPRLIITSTDYSTNTIVKALRAGAKEFLPKPIIKEELVRVLNMFSYYDNEKDNARFN